MRATTNVALCLALLIFASTSSGAVTDLKGQPLVNVCDTAYTDIFALNRGSSAGAVLILDLTAVDASNAGAKAYLFSSDEDMKPVTGAVAEECQKAVANRDFATVQGVLPKEASGTPARWISSPGKSLWIFALTSGQVSKKIKVVETRRKSRIASDVADLLKLVKKAGFAAGAVDMTGFAYTPEESRSDLAVSLLNADDTKSAAIITINAGSYERWFISANLPINSVKQLKLNDSNEVVNKETPKEFLIGFNYSRGDLVIPPAKRWTTDRVFLGGMVRFSKEPLDTVGVAGGYNLGFVSLFAGPIWVRQPKEPAEGNVASTDTEPEMHYKMNWRVGLTFSLSTALGWVGDSAK